MADNTCHFGINHFFADNCLSDLHSWLYFPADAAQMQSVVEKVFYERGTRFIFSTRAKTPFILKEDGSRFFGEDYKFVPGKDDVICEGKDGYVVSFGEMLYRSWDAVLRVRKEGIDVGLINKATLNLVDEETIRKIGTTKFVLVVESQSQKTGVSMILFRTLYGFTVVYFSWDLKWAPGFWNVSLRPSTAIWVRSKKASIYFYITSLLLFKVLKIKAVVVFKSRFLTKDLILNVSKFEVE